MKAIIQTRYGAPEVLRLADVEAPVPKDDEVLVRVRAAAVNIGDWHLMRGIPYVVRLGLGLRRPRRATPGLDIAGDVAAVGSAVTDFQPGDQVFGWGTGAFAEYVCTPLGNLLPKPANLTFDESAAVGDSALTALAAVRDQGRVQPGQRVLINGASGGVGTFAVQIAKALGAHVTAVCSGTNIEMVRSLGADQVVNYEQQDFASAEDRYDVMLDLVGNRPLSACRRVLTPRGTYVIVGVRDVGRWLGVGRQARALLISPFVRRRTRVFVVKHNRADLAVLKDLVEAGRVTPVIDSRYPLGEAADALRHQGEGHPRGKLVLTV